MSARTQELAALGSALDSVGDRWSLMVVAALLDRPQRFGDLREALEGIAPNILSARLRALGDSGLVLASRYSQKPPRFVYELTEAGRELAGALALLSDWGARRGPRPGAPAHAVCGTPLRATWYCETCELAVDDPGEQELHFA